MRLVTLIALGVGFAAFAAGVQASTPQQYWIYFASESCEINAHGLLTIKDYVTNDLSDRPDVYGADLRAYVDPFEHSQSGKKFAVCRATAVSDELIRLGWPERRIKICVMESVTRTGKEKIPQERRVYIRPWFMKQEARDECPN